MRAVEISLLFVILGLFLLKIFNMSYSSELLTLGLLSLSPLYMIGGWFLFKEKNQYSAISILTGFAFGFSLIGSLFKVQSWPFADEMLTFAVAAFVILLIATVVLYFLNNGSEEINQFAVLDNTMQLQEEKNNKKGYCGRMILRLSAMLLFSGGLLFCSSESIFKFCHRDDPELIRLYSQWKKNPDKQEYLDSLKEYRRLHNK